MTSVTFTVPGAPRGKGRPRFARRGAHVTTYTDDQTAAYENLVRLAYVGASKEKLQGAIGIKVTMHHAIPKSKSKAEKIRMIAGIDRPTVKIDADNCLKTVLDGVNGVAFDDDKQVVEVAVEKWYSENPRVEVTLWEVH